MSNMSTAADFTNAAVTAAQNPSTAGYHHGEHPLTVSQAYAENMQAQYPTIMLDGSQPDKLLQLQLEVVVSCAYAEL